MPSGQLFGLALWPFRVIGRPDFPFAAFLYFVLSFSLLVNFYLRMRSYFGRLRDVLLPLGGGMGKKKGGRETDTGEKKQVGDVEWRAARLAAGMGGGRSRGQRGQSLFLVVLAHRHPGLVDEQGRSECFACSVTGPVLPSAASRVPPSLVGCVRVCR